MLNWKVFVVVLVFREVVRVVNLFRRFLLLFKFVVFFIWLVKLVSLILDLWIFG